MTSLQRLKLDVSAPFICFFAMQSVYLMYCFLNPVAESGVIDVVFEVGSWFILSWWICRDAARCRFVLPMSYGFLILFLAPIYAPIYLFQTRGWMGLQTLALFVGAYVLILMVYIAATVASI
jgi:hypothetical protein